jgi:hypothetical protein
MKSFLIPRGTKVSRCYFGTDINSGVEEELWESVFTTKDVVYGESDVFYETGPLEGNTVISFKVPDTRYPRMIVKKDDLLEIDEDVIKDYDSFIELADQWHILRQTVEMVEMKEVLSRRMAEEQEEMRKENDRTKKKQISYDKYDRYYHDYEKCIEKEYEPLMKKLK